MKRILAFVLVFAMLFTVSAFAAFSDVDASTPEGIAIEKLSEMKVLGGFEDGTFKPNDTVTREQFAKILYVFMTGEAEAPQVEDTGFTDVDAGRWSAGFIKWAFDEGIVGGMGDGTFAPANTLTMAQAIKMITVAGGASNDLAWPDGFIAAAEEAGLFENVPGFEPDDPAPRGTIALMVYNSAEEGDGGDVTEPGSESFVEVMAVTAISDGSISVARPLAVDKGQKIDMVEMCNTTTIAFSLLPEASYEIASDAVIQAAVGSFTNSAKLKAAEISEIKASDSSEFYTAEITVEDGVVTAIDFFSTPVPFSYVQKATGYLAIPSIMTVYFGKGSTSEIALGTFVETAGGTSGKLVNFTQPVEGVITHAASGRPFRVDYTFPMTTDMKVGDNVTFTWTCQTTDMKITSTGVCTMKFSEPSFVPDKNWTVKAGDTLTVLSEEMFEGVKYVAGAPFGGASFLIYDTDAKTTVASGETYTTKLGAEVTRSSDGIITYEAPADAAGQVDEFVLQFHDGFGAVMVPVTVTIT